MDVIQKRPTAAHLVSWPALSPDSDISGGTLLWRGVRRVKNRTGHLARLAAFPLHHSPTPLGNYLRRMKTKLGPRAATTAAGTQDRSDLLHHGQKQVEYRECIWAIKVQRGP